MIAQSPRHSAPGFTIGLPLYLCQEVMLHIVFSSTMNVPVQMDQQIIVIVHFVQSLTASKNRSIFSSTIQRSAGKGRTYMGQEDFGNTQFFFVENGINIFLELFLILIWVPFPNFIFVLDIGISRQGSSKPDYAQAYLENILFFVQIHDIWADGSFGIQVGQWVMISRDVEDLALEKVLKEEHDFFEIGSFFLFLMGLCVVITVDDISSDEAVVEMQAVVSHMGSQFVEVLTMVMNITDKDDVQFLNLDVQMFDLHVKQQMRAYHFDRIWLEILILNHSPAAPLYIIAIIFGNYLRFMASRHPAIICSFALPYLTFAVWFIICPKVFKDSDNCLVFWFFFSISIIRFRLNPIISVQVLLKSRIEPTHRALSPFTSINFMFSIASAIQVDIETFAWLSRSIICRVSISLIFYLGKDSSESNYVRPRYSTRS